MITKKCFKCGKEKLLEDFYKHKQTKDGYLGKCKECTKEDSNSKYKDKIKNAEWIFAERIKNAKRSPVKKRTPEKISEKNRRYRERYPYKVSANNSVKRVKCPVGYHKHHWSYNKEHHKDIFILTSKDHLTIHRFMQHDEERLMYRRLDGVLLDSRESAEKYYEYVLSLEYGQYPDFALFDSLNCEQLLS